jgi:hypothetical protein
MSSLDNGELLGKKTNLGRGRGGGSIAQLYTPPSHLLLNGSVLSLI